MSVQQLLVERLAESSEVLKASEGLGPNIRLFVALRETEAQIKALETYRNSLKAEVRPLVRDGEMVGDPEMGHYEVEMRPRTTFNAADALKYGDLSPEVYAKYSKTSESEYLVLKPGKRR